MLDKRVYLFLFVFVLFYAGGQHGVYAQIKDSIAEAKIKTSDSIRSIPLELIRQSIDGKEYKLDTNEYLTKSQDYFGISRLNNIGSPQNTLREGIRFYSFFNHGFHSEDFLYKEIEEFDFYKSNKTYVELMVREGAYFSNSQTGLIDNLNVSAFIAKNFSHDVDLNLSYDRTNQEGIYVNSRNFLGQLNAIIQKKSSTSRLNYSFHYVNQSFKLQHSSGIINDSFLSLPNYSLRGLIDVRSRLANTIVKNNQYLLDISYKLKKDSSSFNPVLFFKVNYKEYINTMSNPENGVDKSFYGKPFLFDSGIINRAYFQYSSGIEFGIRPIISEKWISSISNRIENYHIIQDSVFKSNQPFNLFNFEIARLFELSQLKFNGQFKLQNDRAAHQFTLDYKVQLLKKHNISTSYTFSNELNSVLQNQLYINKKLIWNNSFSPTEFNTLKLAYHSISKFLPSLDINVSSIKNLIILDSTFTLVQEKRRLAYFKFDIKEELYWKWIGLENRFKFIAVQPDPASWNGWYSHHELFSYIYFAKRSIRTRIAATADFAKVDNINYYNPMVDLYSPGQNNQKIFGPFVGFNFNAHIADLTVQLNFDHLDSFWNTARPSIIKGYPIYDFNFRIQLLWKFLN